MTTLKDIIEHCYNTRWQYQKDGERSRDRAMSLQDWGPADKTYPVTRVTQHLKDTGKGNSTVNRHLAALSCAFKAAYDDGLIDSPGPRFKRLPEDGGRDRVPTRYEVAAILAKLRHGDPRSSRLARFLYRTGMRRGEALALSWADVTYAPQAGGRHTACLADTKNGTTRRVPIPSAIGMRPVLGEWRVFQTSASQFSFAWRVARVYAGLGSWFVPHSLRHARATELIRAGTPIPVVMKILGHKNWATTQRYTHPTLGDCQEAMNRR